MELNAAQREIIELLGKGGDRPELAPSLPTDLSEALVEGLAPVRDLIDAAKPVWVSKHQLATIHGCEAHAMAERRKDFEWSPPSARGVVAHKAVELLVNWQGEVEPPTVADEALARLVDADRSIGGYLAGLSAGERAELRGLVVDSVSKFTDCFPPLKPAWRPVTESSVRVELFGGGLVLAGKTDLTLGRPGDKVIIDLKTGGTVGTHREDLRYYALLETLRLGTAPRKVATYYLDSARAHVEDVTEGMLWSALARTVDGACRLLELGAGEREPAVRPGPTCRWCPLADTCETGLAHLAAANDPHPD